MIALLLFIFTFVAYNVENLFDTMHDAGKQDEAFLPNSSYHWTRYRYWRKLDHISQALVSCTDTTLGHLPDLAVLTEVENDTVIRDLTQRSPLRTARYEYIMTNSPDQRGIDITLLYSPFSFRLLNHHAIRINPPAGHRPTRDILYASGLIMSGDTLHVIAVHAPSRAGGEIQSRPYRLIVAKKICDIVDSIHRACRQPLVAVAGDFNDYSTDPSLKIMHEHHLKDVSEKAMGQNGARGTYRFQGEWGSLDHILCNDRFARHLRRCRINDAPFLLEEDKKYGGVKPHRTFLGPRYLGGFSDHLPLVAVFSF